MLSTGYSLKQGDRAVLLSMPHNGFVFPDEVAQQLLPTALASKDTDWFLHRLYQFAENAGCSILKPLYSRYVIDLNRAMDGAELYPGKDTTELCPSTAFDRSALYQAGKKPDALEINRRIKQYWKPYHQALQAEIDRLVSVHSQIVLFEAHSIASVVPRFFSGKLDDFNFGTNDGNSCAPALLRYIQQKFKAKPYNSVYNGRFKGGYITRHYGQPTHGVHGIQLELSQATYLHEAELSWDEGKASHLIPYLEQLFNLIQIWIEK